MEASPRKQAEYGTSIKEREKEEPKIATERLCPLLLACSVRLKHCFLVIYLRQLQETYDAAIS